MLCARQSETNANRNFTSCGKFLSAGSKSGCPQVHQNAYSHPENDASIKERERKKGRDTTQMINKTGLKVDLCWNKTQATSLTESKVNFLFWNNFFFRMLHFPLSVAQLRGLSASLISARQGLFPLPALSYSDSFIHHATYFLRSYDNKLNQRFVRNSTTHSSFSLPSESLLSLTLH